MQYLKAVQTLFVSVVLLQTASRAQDDTVQGPEAAKVQALANKPLVVDLHEGADTAREALDLFVRASQADDHAAALCLVDPPIRKILIPEIIVETAIVDVQILQRAIGGDDPSGIGAIAIAFARRSLINIRDILVLNTRDVDADHVVFDLLTTEHSYHDPSLQTHTLCQFLAIRRSGKWFVFFPFGMMFNGLRSESEEHSAIVVVNKPNEIRHGKRIDFEIVNRVPIERIHEEFVRCTERPAADKVLSDAYGFERRSQAFWNRVKRGDYSSNEQYTQAARATYEPAEMLQETNLQTLLPAIEVLSKLAGQKEAPPSHH
jgi:hypothetical protein